MDAYYEDALELLVINLDTAEGKIYLSQEYKGFNTLEKVEEKDLVVLNISLTLQIYRFQIILEVVSENASDKNKNNEFTIYVEEENSDKHQYIIIYPVLRGCEFANYVNLW